MDFDWQVVSRFVRVEPWNVERPWLLECYCFSRGFKELFQSWEISSPRPHICSVIIDFQDKGSVADLLSQISTEWENHSPFIRISACCHRTPALIRFHTSVNPYATKGLHLPYYRSTHTHISHANASLNPTWCLIIRKCEFCFAKLTYFKETSLVEDGKKCSLLDLFVYWAHCCCLFFCVYICLK